MNLKITDSMSIGGNNDNTSSSRTNQVLLDNDNLVLFKNKYAAVINDTNAPQYDTIEKKYPGITSEEVRIIALLKDYNNLTKEHKEAINRQLFLSIERLNLLRESVSPHDGEAPLNLKFDSQPLKSLQKTQKGKPVIKKVPPVDPKYRNEGHGYPNEIKTSAVNQQIFDYLTHEGFALKPGIMNEFVKGDVTLVIRDNKAIISSSPNKTLTEQERKWILEVANILKKVPKE